MRPILKLRWLSRIQSQFPERFATVHRLSKNRSFARVARAVKESGDGGLSLIELLVAFAIFAIISIVVFNVIDSFQRTQTSVLARGQGTSDGMVVFNQLTRDIRNAQIPITGPVVIYPTTTTSTTSGAAITSFPSNQLELNTTNLDGSSAVVCIIVQTAVSVASVSPSCPNAVAPVSPCPCTLTAYTVTGASNVFRYQVENLTSASIFTLTTPAGGVSPQTVTIDAAFQPNSNEPAVSVQNTIELRNVALSY